MGQKKRDVTKNFPFKGVRVRARVLVLAHFGAQTRSRARIVLVLGAHLPG